MKRVLVFGDLRGNFEGLQVKISAFLRKGQEFDFAVCVGRTLSLEQPISEYKKRNLKMPIPVYFIDSSEISQALCSVHPTGAEIAENIFFLGRSGIRSIQGLQIAFISGVKSSKYSELYSEHHYQKTSFTGPYYSLNDIKLINGEIGLAKDFIGVDLFLSSEWPEGFQKHTNFSQTIKKPSQYIASLANTLSPRYHFCGFEEIHLSRFPYRNAHGHLTRLVCLAGWKSPEKHIMAFQITPISATSIEELKALTEDTTRNPYEIVKSNISANSSLRDQYLKVQREIEQEIFDEEDELERVKTASLIKDRKIEQEERNNILLKENGDLKFSGFDYRTNDDDIIEFLSRWGKISKINIVYDEKSKKHKGYGFILYKDLNVTNQALEDSERYSLHSRTIRFTSVHQTSQTKRQNDKCWFCFSNPSIDRSLIFYEGKHCYLALDKGPISKNHFMIIPYEHLKSSLEFSQPLLDEIQQIRKQMLAIFYRGYQHGLVVYERYVKLSENVSHVLLQCVPLEEEKIQKFLKEFEEVVKKQKIDFFKLKIDEKITGYVGRNEYFFNIDVYENQQVPHRFLYAFQEAERFPMDFGRQIICEILRMTDRLNWKSCALTQSQQTDSMAEMKFNVEKFK